MTSLYEPIVLGDMKLSTRVFMAPLTRNRATPSGVLGRWASMYYSQRASAGLIVSEATQVSPMGKGYINTPGIYSGEQVAGWKPVVDAVHSRNIRQRCGHAQRVPARIFARRRRDYQQSSPSRWRVFRRSRSAWNRIYVVNGGYDAESGERVVANGSADAVAYGHLFLANPDLPARLRHRVPLNVPDTASFYGGDERGYTDYPARAENGS